MGASGYEPGFLKYHTQTILFMIFDKKGRWQFAHPILAPHPAFPYVTSNHKKYHHL